jgi:hypothetical protein
MSHSAPPATFASQRERIARMVEAAGPFLEVERTIANSFLPPEQKTELWVLAWSLLGPQRQKRQIEWISDQAAAYQQASYVENRCKPSGCGANQKRR